MAIWRNPVLKKIFFSFSVDCELESHHYKDELTPRLVRQSCRFACIWLQIMSGLKPGKTAEMLINIETDCSHRSATYLCLISDLAFKKDLKRTEI